MTLNVRFRKMFIKLYFVVKYKMPLVELSPWSSVLRGKGGKRFYCVLTILFDVLSVGHVLE